MPILRRNQRPRMRKDIRPRLKVNGDNPTSEQIKGETQEDHNLRLSQFIVSHLIDQNGKVLDQSVSFNKYEFLITKAEGMGIHGNIRDKKVRQYTLVIKMDGKERGVLQVQRMNLENELAKEINTMRKKVFGVDVRNKPYLIKKVKRAFIGECTTVAIGKAKNSPLLENDGRINTGSMEEITPTLKFFVLLAAQLMPDISKKHPSRKIISLECCPYTFVSQYDNKSSAYIIQAKNREDAIRIVADNINTAAAILAHMFSSRNINLKITNHQIIPLKII